MTSTPSPGSEASAWPIATWRAVPSAGCTESCTTGTSASGYIQRSGTQAP